MRRFLTLTLMMVMAVVAAEQVTVDITGLTWRDMSHFDRTNFVTGSIVGSDAEDVFRNVSMTAQHHKGTVADVVRELDAFYEVPANVPLPVWTALVYVHMKLDGTAKETLDVFVRNARQVVAAKQVTSAAGTR